MGLHKDLFWDPSFLTLIWLIFFECIDDADISNFADDNTPFAMEKDIDMVITKLEENSMKLFEWLETNMFKANPGKSHLILSSNDTTKASVINGIVVPNENQVGLLGITFDNALSFEKHVTKLCKQASRKLQALSRISIYMDMEKRRTLMNSFFLSQYSYCPLIWMFHSRTLNNRINKLHERCLRVVYRDFNSSFEQLLSKDNSFTIHERNIQNLAIELFKVKMGLAPKFMNEIFIVKESSRYPSKQIFVTHNVRTVTYGINTLSHMGPKIWLLIPDEIKASCTCIFKRKIRKWKPVDCPFRLCKTYLDKVGFI